MVYPMFIAHGFQLQYGEQRQHSRAEGSRECGCAYVHVCISKACEMKRRRQMLNACILECACCPLQCAFNFCGLDLCAVVGPRLGVANAIGITVATTISPVKKQLVMEINRNHIMKFIWKPHSSQRVNLISSLHCAGPADMQGPFTNGKWYSAVADGSTAVGKAKVYSMCVQAAMHMRACSYSFNQR